MYIYILCRLAVSDKIGLYLKFGPLATATTVNCKDLPSSTLPWGVAWNVWWKATILALSRQLRLNELSTWTPRTVNKGGGEEEEEDPTNTINDDYEPSVQEGRASETTTRTARPLGLNKANPLLLACCSPSKVQTHRTSAGRESPCHNLPSHLVDIHRNRQASSLSSQWRWVRWFFSRSFRRFPSGKLTKNYEKSPFLMGKSTINGHFQ